MPRPTATIPDQDGRLSWPHMIVDAPDAYISAASVQIVDGVLTVLSKKGAEIGRYTLDREPSIDTDDLGRVASIVAVTDGAPLIARPDTGCTCHGTRKVIK